MVWKCPACGTQIRLLAAAAAPQAGVVYRCNVCRLELVVDEKTEKLIVPPLTGT
jgi:predicted Zn finger-like uncharacterized protein